MKSNESIEKLTNYINNILDQSSLNNSKRQTFEDYPKINEYRSKLEQLDSYNLDDMKVNIHNYHIEETYKFIENTQELINDAYDFWIKVNRMMYSLHHPMQYDINKLDKMKKILDIYTDPLAAYYYDTTITMPDKIDIYEPYSELERNYFEYNYFKELCRLLDDKSMSKEEFVEWAEGNACSDWSKQDEHGECYGGYWKYPEDSEEYENAYDLSREKNLKLLSELTVSLCYEDNLSYKFLQWTVDYGCSNRLESVRYSANLAYWFIEKKRIMDIYESSLPNNN